MSYHDQFTAGEQDRLETQRLCTALPGWDDGIPRELPEHPEQSVIGVLPGEGIGPEVIQVTLEVLRGVARHTRRKLEIRLFDEPIGTAAQALGDKALPDSVVDFCKDIFAEDGALLCGPGGSRFVYDLRAQFDLYCKLVPVRPVAALRNSGPLRPAALEDADIIVVRENCSGLYFGSERRELDSAGRPQSMQMTFGYNREQVRRIIDCAMRLAVRRSGRLALVVKPAGAPAMCELWSDVFHELVTGTDLSTRVLEIDNACYQVIAAAREFDVIVTSNLFGDILGDTAALLLGSRGMSYSANFGAGTAAVFQTAHGAARELAGRDVANPIGQVLSAAMLLRESFGMLRTAAAIERGVEQILAEGFRTADIAGPDSAVVGTREMGRRLATAVEYEVASLAVPR